MSKAFDTCLVLKAKNVNHVQLARVFAQIAHVNQKRKFSDEPYIQHLDEVAYHISKGSSVKDYMFQEYRGVMYDAAYLHDTLEDTDVTKEEIEILFGKECADTVVMLTDVSKPKDGNRAIRKALDRAHLANANAVAKAIKFADLLSNLRAIPKSEPFYTVFKEEAKLLLPVLKTPCPENAIHVKRSGQKEFPEKLVTILEEMLNGTFVSPLPKGCSLCSVWGGACFWCDMRYPY